MASQPITEAQVKQAKRAAARSPTIVGDPVMRRSADSAAMLPYWDRVDAIMDGIEGMRLAADEYLPKFTDESPEDYNFRLTQTKMTNVFSDIVEGLASKPFEQNVTLREPDTAPQSVQNFIMDVDGSGNTITAFAGHTFYQGISNAIDWICVDYPKRNPNIRNLADAKRAGLKPYWSHVLGRNVLEVQSRVIGGNELLTYIRIHEPGDPDRVREYTRTDDGIVSWALFEKKTEDKEFVRVDGDTLMGIDKIPMIPFYTGRRIGRSWKFVPPMKAAAELQIEVYQQESGLKFAKNITAYPMLAANGIAPPLDASGKPNYKVVVGPNRVLWSVADRSGNIGRWEYLEPSAESLKFLADDIERTIRELRELGRQPLTAQSGNITVITAAVAAGKAKSAVKAWAFTLQNALEEALILTAQWMGEKYDADVSVFTEFDEFTEGEDLEALDKARDRNDISRETHWEELKRRNVLSGNFTPERENKRLLEELPSDVTTEGGDG